MINTNDEGERTLWCGNIDHKVTEELLYELFLQAGPLEKVKIVEDKGYGPNNYAFITFKHSVSVPYTLQLMDGIRLYGQALRLKARNGSGNTERISGKVEAVFPQVLMGPPQVMPPSLARPPSMMPMHPANSATFSQSISGRHAGLMRSSSEPEGLGRPESRRTANLAQVHERSPGPYCRPYAQQRMSQGVLAQNIASQLYRFNQAVPQRNPQFDARNSYASPQWQQNHHAHGGFRR